MSDSKETDSNSLPKRIFKVLSDGLSDGRLELFLCATILLLVAVEKFFPNKSNNIFFIIAWFVVWLVAWYVVWYAIGVLDGKRRHRIRAAKASRTYDDAERYAIYLRQATISDDMSPSPASDSSASKSSTAESLSDFERTLANMMRNNAASTREFQTSNMHNNQTAFKLSAAICFLGLIVILASAAMTALGKLDAGVTLGTTVVGAIVEIASGTSLVLYRRSANQSSTYYEALHENERTLYAMHVAMLVANEEKRDAIFAEMAANLTSPARDPKADDKDDKPQTSGPNTR